MIKRVLLENWKTHSRSELFFGQGTNVLVGRMGAGKTSVMDAICFALFGTFPSLNSRRVSLDEVVMNRPNQMDFCRVEMDFDYAGKNYAVERTINFGKKANEAKLFCAGKLVAGPGVSDVTKRIEDTIELDFELFSRAVYSEQNELDFFLRMSPAQRKAKFDELLDLEKYENARASASTASGRLKAQAKDQQKVVEKIEQDATKADLESLRKRLAEKAELEGKYLAEKLVKESELQAAEKGLAELEKAEAAARQLNDNLIRAVAGLEEAGKGIERARKMLAGRNADEIRKSLGEKEALAKGIDEKEIPELESELKKRFNESNTVFRKSELCRSKISELRKKSERLAGLEAVCPTCYRDLSDGDRKSVIGANESEKASLEKELTVLAAELEKSEGLKNTAEENARSAMKRLSLEKDGIREAKALLAEALELEKKEADAKAMEEKASELGKLVSGQKFSPEDLRAARKKAGDCDSTLKVIGKGIESNRELMKTLEAAIEKAEATLQVAESMKQEIVSLEKASLDLSVFVSALLSAQAELRQTMIESVNEALADIWPRVYPYRDYVGARLEIVDGNYELKARHFSGAWTRIDGILSGGERSSAAICVRIAFSLVLTQNLGIIILDEPTHNLDSSAVEALTTMLKTHLPQLVGQVFIITHDKEMEKAASSSLYQLDREKDSAEATKIISAETQ